MKKTKKKSINQILLVLMVLVFFGSLWGESASAISKELKSDLNRGILYYDADCSIAAQSATSEKQRGGASNSPGDIRKVYILGDSITLGAKDAIIEGFRSTGDSISAAVNASVSRSVTRPGVTEGNKTSGLDAVKQDASTIKDAQAVVIALGTNADGDGSPTTYKNSMNRLISDIDSVNSSAQIYVVSIFSPAVTKRDAYNSLIDQLNKNPQTIDMANKGIKTPDRIHPDAAGQKIFAETIVGAVSATEASESTEDTSDSDGSCACVVSESGSTSTTSASTGEIKEYPNAVDSSLVPELKKIRKDIENNLAAYQAAASRWGIPWQALAATHWREGTAGSRKSMVNGTSLPEPSELGGRQYIWGSADARIATRSVNKSAIPIGNGGAPPRRFYSTLQQDIDYATWLLIEHGTRRQFSGNPETFLQKVRGPGLSKEEWTNTWSAYLGGASLGYGSFSRDNQGRMGAGAIMAFFGGLNEKPPIASVQTYPGKSDSDYDKVADGVDGAVTAGQGASSGLCPGNGTTDGSGVVSADGYAFPIAAKKKSDYETFGALSPVPCNTPGACHHPFRPPAGYAFDLGVKGYGPDRSQNAPVFAISDGVLVRVNTNDTRGGNVCNSVTLKSSKDNYIYWYGHLRQDTSFKTGQKVTAGQIIGHVGDTRCADVTAPHLHISRVKEGSSTDSQANRDRGIVDIINKTYEALPD